MILIGININVCLHNHLEIMQKCRKNKKAPSWYLKLPSNSTTLFIPIKNAYNTRLCLRCIDFFLSINSDKNINQDEFVIIHDVITLICNHWL